MKFDPNFQLPPEQENALISVIVIGVAGVYTGLIWAIARLWWLA